MFKKTEFWHTYKMWAIVLGTLTFSEKGITSVTDPSTLVYLFSQFVRETNALVIHGSRSSDSGVYVCEARDRFDETPFTARKVFPTHFYTKIYSLS
jgi:hypothetical protein